MKICAVVVTYNRKELLEKQIIEILHNQELKIDAYYVIDNCSTDGTRSLVKEYEGTVIKYCKTKSNCGGAGGFSYGLQRAFEDNYNKSIKLVEEMNTFFDLYNNYTNFKYTSYIKLLKEREIISHYVRFKKYDQIVKTEFYKKYYTFIDKIKLFVKWRLSPLYVIYKKKNNI